MAFIEWWNSLELASQIFYCIAIPSTLVLLIQTVMMFFGFENDADADFDIDLPDSDMEIHLPDTDIHDGIFGDDGIVEPVDPTGLESLHIFTVRGIIAFLVVFGWVGVVLQDMGLHLLITAPIAAICGFAMMFIIAYLFRSVMKLRSDGTADNRNAVGAAGKVHLTIPPSRTGEGKVHVMLQGAYVERNAVTDETESIPTGCEIIVVGLSGQTSLVVKRK